MKNITILAIAIACGLSHNVYAKSDTTKWDSDLVKNYKKVGSTIKALTNLDENSRWYFNGFLKGGYNTSTDHTDYEKAYFKLMMRMRGYTALTDRIGFVGDVRMEAQENWVDKDDKVTDRFDNFDDKQKIDQFRVGFEDSVWGFLGYGKYTATMASFSNDVAITGLYNNQSERGRKNAGKIIYDSHYDNNLYVYASYDVDSDIMGMDFGYQTADIYSRESDSFGAYLAVHNGQPGLFVGSKGIWGNRGAKTKDSYHSNSDTNYERTDKNLLTYTFYGYKQFAMAQRMSWNFSYSKMDDNENGDIIRNQGYATKGLGASANVTYSLLPKNGEGFSPTIIVNLDELDKAFELQLKYFINRRTTIAISEVMSDKGDDQMYLESRFNF